MPMTTGESIAEELRHAVKGDAWHGPALSEIVDGISAEEAMQRPIPAGHNIWELVLHITSWAKIALRRINGGKPQALPGEDWPESGEFSEDRWKQITADMVEAHERLCEVVAGLSDEELQKKAPGSSRSIAFMLHGVAQHDAYHGGQMSLLKKLVTTKHRRAAL
jgi:uncharacterized damage-inducible protein DinB